MADLDEAFDVYKLQKEAVQNIDYFFTQRTVSEEHEYLDKNMNRQVKKVKVTYNFLALNIPLVSNLIQNKQPIGFIIEIHGDNGYHYKGTTTCYQGIIPSLMIQIKNDKRIFVNINYTFSESENDENVRKFISFIDIPRRYQTVSESNTNNDNTE
jgi:hypothetical protein